MATRTASGLSEFLPSVLRLLVFFPSWQVTAMPPQHFQQQLLLTCRWQASFVVCALTAVLFHRMERMLQHGAPSHGAPSRCDRPNRLCLVFCQRTLSFGRLYRNKAKRVVSQACLGRGCFHPCSFTTNDKFLRACLGASRRQTKRSVSNFSNLTFEPVGCTIMTPSEAI